MRRVGKQKKKLTDTGFSLDFNGYWKLFLDGYLRTLDG